MISEAFVLLPKSRYLDDIGLCKPTLLFHETYQPDFHTRTMLPTELCNLVIDHFHDSKPSLLTCSLVRRARDPESRFHIFQKVQLCRDTADSFFQLIESPHAILASAHIRELDVAQNSVTEGGSLAGDLLDGRAFQGVLTRCPADVFEHVQKLSVTCVGRWTLINAEKLSIGHRVKSVTELRSWMIVFQTDEEFQALITPIQALKSCLCRLYCSGPRIRRKITRMPSSHFQPT
ncbi:uncharacterized protein BT62DRAFT_445944 [Guyanagaster necrorhizus]|uniref:Uncharacterized protein n=1 Tax=Guyanagaster necrorhizus TaxID=856835 RepID=A0A9P7VKH0_9AGAR|nr:uncharacterized protein BT62DRAFT_445944 [Guyanagaster necrorhizus MCA 3950]KAG7442374.1 hypothetical protein BT62DRAFT_445944 [Guyanagaster necrorhizus MCA 3950]